MPRFSRISSRFKFAVDYGRYRSRRGIERDLLVERAQAGLTRAKAQSRKLIRPRSLTQEQRAMVTRRFVGNFGERTRRQSLSDTTRSFS